MLGQKAVIPDKGGDFWRPLGFIVNCSMDVHVSVQDSKEFVFTLQDLGKWKNK